MIGLLAADVELAERRQNTVITVINLQYHDHVVKCVLLFSRRLWMPVTRDKRSETGMRFGFFEIRFARVRPSAFELRHV